MKLQDKKIIITGATGGIGGSLVKTFTDQNAKILAKYLIGLDWLLFKKKEDFIKLAIKAIAKKLGI